MGRTLVYGLLEDNYVEKKAPLMQYNQYERIHVYDQLYRTRQGPIIYRTELVFEERSSFWVINEDKILRDTPPKGRRTFSYAYRVDRYGTPYASFELVYVEGAGDYLRIDEDCRKVVFSDLRIREGHHVQMVSPLSLHESVIHSLKRNRSLLRQCAKMCSRVFFMLAKGRKETDNTSMNT